MLTLVKKRFGLFLIGVTAGAGMSLIGGTELISAHSAGGGRAKLVPWLQRTQCQTLSRKARRRRPRGLIVEPMRSLGHGLRRDHAGRPLPRNRLIGAVSAALMLSYADDSRSLRPRPNPDGDAVGWVGHLTPMTVGRHPGPVVTFI